MFVSFSSLSMLKYECASLLKFIISSETFINSIYLTRNSWNSETNIKKRKKWLFWSIKFNWIKQSWGKIIIININAV